MKPPVLTSMLLLFISITAKAQLSFLPQIGFEKSKTSVRVNDLSSFSPIGSTGNLKANLRADYRFKKGHGPYVAFGTNPGAVAYSFTDPSTAMSNFKAATNSLQWRFEGGYQYSSKPITLKKASKTQPAKATTHHTEVRRSCGSYYNYHKQKTTTATTKQNNNLNLRLQPSLGIAYIPSVQENLKSGGTTYQYNAGNYKTALVSGMGIEFGKGKQRLFTLSAFYAKGLSNLKEQEISSLENNKITNTTLNSKTSSWGMTIGVPFSFSKTKKTVVTPVKPTEHKEYKSKCGSYQGRCTKRI
jgi:hypothetical protein